jgi:DNA-binding XRE family transcriptional regulator
MIKRINIQGLNRNYYISDDGRIFNKDMKELKPSATGYNYNDKANHYCYVTLIIDGKRKNKYIHRLVAEAFIPNPNNYPQVNHKDGNRCNNSVQNLEWCSNIQNQLHKLEVLNIDYTGEKNPANKLSKDEVLKIKELLENSNLSQKKIGDMFGISQTTIHEIKYGYVWSHVTGYKKQYKKKGEHCYQ